MKKKRIFWILWIVSAVFFGDYIFHASPLPFFPLYQGYWHPLDMMIAFVIILSYISYPAMIYDMLFGDPGIFRAFEDVAEIMKGNGEAVLERDRKEREEKKEKEENEHGFGKR